MMQASRQAHVGAISEGLLTLKFSACNQIASHVIEPNGLTESLNFSQWIRAVLFSIFIIVTICIIGWMLARCGDDCAGRGENHQLERQRAAYHFVAKIAVVLALSRYWGLCKWWQGWTWIGVVTVTSEVIFDQLWLQIDANIRVTSVLWWRDAPGKSTVKNTVFTG